MKLVSVDQSPHKTKRIDYGLPGIEILKGEEHHNKTILEQPGSGGSSEKERVCKIDSHSQLGAINPGF